MERPPILNGWTEGQGKSPLASEAFEGLEILKEKAAAKFQYGTGEENPPTLLSDEDATHARRTDQNAYAYRLGSGADILARIFSLRSPSGTRACQVRHGESQAMRDTCKIQHFHRACGATHSENLNADTFAPSPVSERRDGCPNAPSESPAGRRKRVFIIKSSSYT